MYFTTKTYGHERGFSCCFRNPYATHSHCSKLHGYALKFVVTFAANNLDHRDWVVDFGSLKDFKATLDTYFDHKTLVNKDDPQLDKFYELEDAGIADLVVLDAVGCEAFAKLVFELADIWLQGCPDLKDVWVHKVEVHEHPGNSASYT